MFAELTLGSFTELRTEVGEDDQPILLGRRANGDTVRIDGMSDGTADPLYLSLRLASLASEKELARRAPSVRGKF